MPGIYIAYPSSAADAKGLLKMSCRMNDPVSFMEHKGLYRQGYAATEEPDEEYTFVREELFLKVISLRSLHGGHGTKDPSKQFSHLHWRMDSRNNDLRTLNPIDIDLIRSSIEKTSKVLVVHEDNLTNGPGAEISALIADKYFELLDGPVRIAAKDSPVPFNWLLEEKCFPDRRHSFSY